MQQSKPLMNFVVFKFIWRAELVKLLQRPR